MKNKEIKRVEPYPGIVHLTYPTQGELAASFLRPQEYYESLKFKERIPFTLDEFKKWYIANSEEGKKTGKFTYYSDWDAFYVPDPSFTPFFQGRFNPLSRREKTLLNLLPEGRKFCAIGTFKGADETDIPHEIAHGLTYLNPDYKARVLEVVRNMNPKDRKIMEDYLRSTGAGYNPAVFEDEIHAHVCHSLDYLQKEEDVQVTESMRQTSRKLQDIFRKFVKIKK